MTEFVEAVASPLNLLWVVLIFGVAPGIVLRLFVLLYPKGDPRRRELVAELYMQGRIERLLWVGEQVETAVVEGVGARWAQRTRGWNQRVYRVTTLSGWASVPFLVFYGYELLIPDSIWVWRPRGSDLSDWAVTFWSSSSPVPITFSGAAYWLPIVILPGRIGVTGLTFIVWLSAAMIVGALRAIQVIRRRSSGNGIAR